MDISSLTGITSADYSSNAARQILAGEEPTESFQSVFDAALNMLSETNAYQNDSQAAKFQFVLGEADNPHDMQIAGEKALTALQYTVAVRDKMLEAYKEIMNMQI